MSTKLYTVVANPISEVDANFEITSQYAHPLTATIS
jgi:hypothetical protein